MSKHKKKTRPPTRGAKPGPTTLLSPQPSSQPFQLTPRTSYPSHRSKKESVLKAHLKHNIALVLALPEAPTLAYRFFALPRELRNKIYSILVVRPCKWDVQHDPACRPYDWSPDHEMIPFADNKGCLRCMRRTHYIRPWHVNQYLGHDSRILSSWAPQRLNPFLCSNCHSQNFRQTPYPSFKDLTCLCPRRRDLDILLSSHRLADEASHVFWTSNTFTFGHRDPLLRFLQNVTTPNRAKITRLSFLASYLESTSVDTMDGAGLECYKSHSPLHWKQIASLSNLAILELDYLFLLDWAVVKHFCQIHSLSRKSFYVRAKSVKQSPRFSDDGTLILERGVVAKRRLVKGGYAGEVAGLMKRRGPSSVKVWKGVWERWEEERVRLENFAEDWNKLGRRINDGGEWVGEDVVDHWGHEGVESR